MDVTFDNTTNPKAFQKATFSGRWMEFTAKGDRRIKLAIDSVTGANWEVQRLIDLVKLGQHTDFDVETFGSDALRIYEKLAKRASKGEPYCHQGGRAVDIFFANIEVQTAWKAVKKDFTGDVHPYLALALDADKVFEGHAFQVLDAIASLYALVGDFGKAVDYESRAVKLCEAWPKPTEPEKAAASKLRERLELFRSGKPYREESSSRRYRA